MKPSKKLKVDQVISSLFDEIDSETESEEEDDHVKTSCFSSEVKINRSDSNLRTSNNKVPFKSIENKINILVQKQFEKGPIKLDSDDESDDDLPLSKLIIKKSNSANTSIKIDENKNAEDDGEDDDDDEDDIPLSVFVSKNGLGDLNSYRKLTQIKKRIVELNKNGFIKDRKQIENSCIFFKGIYNFVEKNQTPDLNLNDIDSQDSSFLEEDSDSEVCLNEKNTITSPIIKLENRFILSIKNAKRKLS